MHGFADGRQTVLRVARLEAPTKTMVPVVPFTLGLLYAGRALESVATTIVGVRG
jgi:hypothetical protein